MDSGLPGAPPSATTADFCSNTISGIRAPLTIDESDFEYSASSKSRRNGMASGYYSELDEPEGSASGRGEKSVEKIHPYHEYEFYKASVVKSNREELRKESISDENRFSRPSVRNPGEKSVTANQYLSSFKAFSGNPDERFYRFNANDCDDFSSFLSESGDEFVENDNNSSRLVVATADEENFVGGPTKDVDNRLPMEQKLHIPIAKLSRDSDGDSQGSELFEDKDFFGVVRIPIFDVLSKLNSAPKVRMSDDDDMDEYEWQAESMGEMEFVKELVINNDVSGPEDENNHTGVDEIIKDCVIPCETIKDEGDGANEEDKANSLAVNDEHELYNPMRESEENRGFMHSDEEIHEIGVADDGERLILEENFVFNQNVEIEKVETERELETEHTTDFFSSTRACKNRSSDQCVDIVKDVHGFLGSPVALPENMWISISDRHLGNDGSSIGGDDNQYLFEASRFEQKMGKEAENNEKIRIEVECESMASFTEMKGDVDTLSYEQLLLDHSQEIDDLIFTDTDDNGVAGTDNFSREIASRFLGTMLVSSRLNSEAKKCDLLGPQSTSDEQEGPFCDRESRKKLERIHQIRVKYLQLVHSLGHSTEDSITLEVLRQLSIAEAKYPSQEILPNTARNEAMGLEAQEKSDLDFSLRILVIGKAGVGKSATVNSIFGEIKTAVNTFEPSTSCVMEINGEVAGVKVKIFDTPGLGISAVDQSTNQKILLSIKKAILKSPPDIVLYVDRLDTHFSPDDWPLLKSVALFLGPSIWQNLVLVFTHADSLPPDGPSDEDFVAEKSRAVQQLLIRAAVETNGGRMIPVSLVENHLFSEKKVASRSWGSRLLLLCCSVKVSLELNRVVMVHNIMDRAKTQFGLRFLESSYGMITRPVFELYDDSISDRGVLVEDNGRFPAVISVGLFEDEQELNIRLCWVGGDKGLGASKGCLSSVKIGCYSGQLRILGLLFIPIGKALFDKIFR